MAIVMVEIEPGEGPLRCDECGALAESESAMAALVAEGAGLDAGSVVPAGRCLHCGGLVYPEVS